MVNLSLCIIVGKDEAQELETLLKSVQGPLFDEIVVTTTQKDPKVLEVARRYADVVPHFDWVHDFSAARNFCFDQSSGNYIMWLDADDEVSPEAYKALLELKPTLESFDYSLISYNYAQDKNGNPVLLLPRERIVKRSPDLRWSDPIHEFITTHGGHRCLKRTDITIDHRRKRKYDATRNLSILEGLYLSGKATPRNKFYYAKDLYENGGAEKAVPILEEYLQGPFDFYQNKAVACLKLAEFYKGTGNVEARTGYLQKSLLFSQEYAEAYYGLGEVLEGKGELDNAIAFFEKALGCSPDNLFGAKIYFHVAGPLDSLTRVHAKKGETAKALYYTEKFLEVFPEDQNYLFNRDLLKKQLTYPPAATPQAQTPVTPRKSIRQIRVGWALENICPEDPSQRIRRLNTYRELKGRGVKVSLATGYHQVPDEGWVVDRWAQDFDVVVFSSFTPRDLSLMGKLQGAGVKVIVDLNEDILENTSVQDAIKAADGVVLCSSRLQEKARTLAKRTLILEDSVEPDEGEPYDHFLPLREGKPVALFMGMGGNSFLVTDYLKDTIERAGYHLEVCTEWENATIPWTLETWREVMKSAHVVLCPQRVDVQPCKSNIKAAQAMAFGIPTVASPLQAYKDFIIHGENGYICNTKEDWYQALVSLKDIKKRIQLGLNGELTADKFSISNMADKWSAAIENLFSLPAVTKVETPAVVTPPAAVRNPIPIIIPVYNGVEYLKACITSIHMNTTHPYHIVLSDAGSNAETWEYLNTLKGITVLGKPGERKNFSEAVNEGVHASGSSKYFAVLNSDVLVSKGWLEALVEKMDTKDRLAACGVLSNCDRQWLHGREGLPVYNMRLPQSGVELVPGMKYQEIIPHLDELNAFMEESNKALKGTYTPQKWVAYYATVFARSAWEDVGDLDPVFKNGCEDLDHCRRLRGMHYEIGQAIDSFVYHFGGISRGAYQDENKESYDEEDRYNHDAYANKWNKKRIVIYTGPAWEKWNRDTVDKGMAGSETWASELGASFVEKGFAVTIFNDCPVDGEVDKYGVEYRSHTTFPEWLKYRYVDYMILSRTCYPLHNFRLHTGNVYVMVHDVFLDRDKGYDTRAWAVKKFACLSDWHTEFFSDHHSISKEKIMLTANGVRGELYQKEAPPKKNMAVYSSSPDRGLESLLGMLPMIREQVPDFELVVAYGFHNWKSAAISRGNAEEIKRIENMEEALKQPGVKYVGRVDKETLANLQLEAKVWLYPSWFSETFCITLVENGFAGNAAVTTPYAGILTTGADAPVYVRGPEGVPPHLWPESEGFAEKFVGETVKLLKDEEYWRENAKKMTDNALRYTWGAAADGWLKEWGNPSP